MASRLSCLEICAGAGGQSLGLELAGFDHELAVEIEADACQTLRLNRPHWGVFEGDVRKVDGTDYRGIDLLAGGVPCPPFSIAGKQLGEDDERDLFPEALRLVAEARPKAVMLENVRGLSTAKFQTYRNSIKDRLADLGYQSDWQVLNASEFGVPQLRPRFILVAALPEYFGRFEWPGAQGTPPTVGESLHHLMARDGWRGADAWSKRADGIGPTIVGGSRKHGGPDLKGSSGRRPRWCFSCSLWRWWRRLPWFRPNTCRCGDPPGVDRYCSYSHEGVLLFCRVALSSRYRRRSMRRWALWAPVTEGIWQ